MKKYFLSLILFYVTSVFGQMSFTPPPMPMMNMHNDLMFMNYSRNPIYRCEIYLNDGSIFEGESGIYKNVDGEFYINIDKEKYFPSDTDSVYINQAIGLPRENHWIFEVLNGKLSVFSKYPTYSLNKNCFIKKNSGDLIPYKLSNLKIEIKDNPDALALFNSIQKRKMIGNTMSFSGLAAIMMGFGTLPKDGTEKEFSELPQSKIIITGGLFTIIGFFINRSSPETYYDVIKKYNE